jgi:hypothetical protein
MNVTSIRVWSRYILTTESSPSYEVYARDCDFAALEVGLATQRVRMWPRPEGMRSFAERVDNLSRGLVETCHRLEPIQCDAYPEGL